MTSKYIVVNVFQFDSMSIVLAFSESVPVSAKKGKGTCPVYDKIITMRETCDLIVCIARIFGEH